MEQGLKANTNCATKAIGYRQALELLERCRAEGRAPTAELLVRRSEDDKT